MSLIVGSSLGPYEILSPLGVGGMGEVYRARDKKLGRDVAIKILLSSVAGDPARLARFAREAQVLASLNHPNIAHIHGLEDSTGVPALVMELVEGPTLADRIAHGAVPLDEALPIAKQIAEALEAAHEKGIIHRDLKPANIKITPDGQVKVLDFGLAKASESDAAAGNLSDSPTTMNASMLGMLLGTPAYMSPEQAKGRPVDKRADIFAFGCVFYEMLTGTRAFDGDDVADVLSAVLRTEPDWARLPSSVPPGVRRLLRLCLEKNAKNRRSDATDVRLDIEHALESPAGGPAAVAASSRQTRAAWIVAAVASAAAVTLALVHFRPAPVTPGDVTRLVVTPPVGSFLDPSSGNNIGTHPALSPDGRKLAFVVVLADGSRAIAMRDLSAVDAQIIPNTKDADRPFWSADGRHLGFAANNQLQKIAVSAAGAPEIICAAPISLGATWNRDGLIVFSSQGSLYRIDGHSGRPIVIKQQSGSDRYYYPQFLPNERDVLYTAVSSREPNRGGFVVSLDTGATKRVTDADYKVLYSAGYLLTTLNGSLFAQPFSTTRLEVSGEARRLPDRVGYSYNASREAAFDASANGFVYSAPFTIEEQLTWFDRSGHAGGKVGPVGEYRVPVLSPDGRRLAFDRMPSGSEGRKVWMLDLATEALTLITSSRTNDWAPLWSPDGKTLVFSSDRDGPYPSLYRHASDGQGADQLMFRADFDARAQSWAAPGLLVSGRTTVRTIQLVNPDAHTSVDVPNTGTFHAQFSPDGKFILYQSNESGTEEVYLRRFPVSAERWRVSQKGGLTPLWKGDGREVYYLRPDGHLVATQFRADPQVNIGGEVVLFQTPFQSQAQFLTLRSAYAVAPDGSRFLFPNREERHVATSMVVILNWPAILQH